MSQNDPVSTLVWRWYELRQQGTPINIDELCASNPGLRERVRQEIANIQRVEQPGDVLAIRPAGKFPELTWSIGVRSGEPYHEVAIAHLGNTRAIELGTSAPTGRIWVLDWSRRPLPTGGRARCAPDWASGSSRVVCLQ